MTFLQNLKKGRSQLVFVGALLSASALILVLENRGVDLQETPAVPRINAVIAKANPLPVAEPRKISQKEYEQARIAWKYFENNTNAETMLVNSANGYPSTTIWDTGSYLIGLISAHRLGIVDTEEFDRRMNGALASIAKLELFDGVLPNKAYDVRTLKMASYDNKRDERGLGWSTLDVSRFLVPLAYVLRNHPEHAGAVEDVLSRWDLSRLVKDGEMVGTAVRDGETVLRQEGRVGYEQYGAKAMMMFGLDAVQATQAGRNADFQEMREVDLPVDKRSMGGGSAFVTSEPYMLDGLDFGFDSISHALASNVYRVQEKRFEDTGIHTAVSESHISEAPYFVYSTIWGGGDEWAVMRLDGTRYDEKRTLSTKAAFAWDALFATDYTKTLVRSINTLADPEKGWMEGRYELDGSPNSSITCNTNGVVLAAIAFKQFGPLMRHRVM